MRSRVTPRDGTTPAPKRGLITLIAGGVLLVASAGIATSALALNGQFPLVRDLSPAGIAIDGERGDWDTFPADLSPAQNQLLDRMGPLYLGDPVGATPTTTPAPYTTTIAGDIYARYDCGTQTLFVRVEARDAASGAPLPVRDGAGNEFVVDGHVVGDVSGSAGSLAYIAPGAVTGWEAAFGPLAPGTYSFTARAVLTLATGDVRAAAFGDSQQVTVGSACASATATPVASATPTQAPSATPTQAPSATPTQAPSATPTQAPTATPTPTATAPATATPVATATPAPSVTATPSATPGATPTPTTTPGATVTPTPAPTATPTVSPTPTPAGGVAGATATPRTTLPPTDTGSLPVSSGRTSFAIVLTGLALAILALVASLAASGRRPSRRAARRR